VTKELFRENSYLKSSNSVVTAIDGHGIQLDATVFYPTGGGQPGDSGWLEPTEGGKLRVVDTIKDRNTGELLHIIDGNPNAISVGEKILATIDWDRRYKLMRMHTAMHILCSIIEGGVTGGQVGEEKSRIDFDLPDTSLDKLLIQSEFDRLISEDHIVQHRWITDQEMQANVELVRTMSVKPPTGTGKVRLLEIAEVDLQPCGGTHVARTREIGHIRVGKIENKGKHNRRVNIHLEDYD